MRLAGVSQRMIATDAGILVLCALSVFALHTVTNGQYGFRRDELATVDDARFLSRGYVVYPPFTPFIARVALTLFGTSLIGLRFFAALAPARIRANIYQPSNRRRTVQESCRRATPKCRVNALKTPVEVVENRERV